MSEGLERGFRPALEKSPGSGVGRRDVGAADRLVAGLVLALTLLAYSGTLEFGFVFDDYPQILESPLVQEWRYLPRYFTSNVWSYIYPHDAGNYYRPLFLLWLRVNHALFGFTAWKWHLTTLAVHVLVTLLVYWLARRLLKDRRVAFVAAMVFGLHPVHVEAVAWVSGVPEPLMVLFLTASFLCYLRQWEQGEPGSKRRGWWLAVSLVLYAVSLLAKEMSVVMPLLIFAFAWIFWPGKDASDAETRGRAYMALRAMAPYLALTAGYLVARAIALKGLIHPVSAVPLWTMVLTWPSLLWFYLKLLVWPVALSAFYDLPYVTRPDLRNFVWPALVVAAFVVALVAWFHWIRGKRNSEASDWESRAVAFASTWLGLPVLMLLNTRVFPQGEIAHDRYLYLSSVGFSMLVALALRRVSLGRARLFGENALQVGLASILACLLGFGTAYQSVFWADDISLYSRGVAMAPNNTLAKTNLAMVACERGLYSAGIRLFKEVLQRDPYFWVATFNLARTYYKLGNLREAEQHFRRTIQMNPYASHAFLYLGLIWMDLGRLNEAQGAVRRAIELHSESLGYHFVLGHILKKQGDLPGALNEFRAELGLQPNFLAARAEVAEIEARLRRK